MGMKDFDERNTEKSKHNGMTFEGQRNFNATFFKQKMKEGYRFKKIMENTKAGAEKGRHQAEKPEEFGKAEEILGILEECKNPDGSLTY